MTRATLMISRMVCDVTVSTCVVYVYASETYQFGNVVCRTSTEFFSIFESHSLETLRTTRSSLASEQHNFGVDFLALRRGHVLDRQVALHRMPVNNIEIKNLMKNLRE